MLCFLADVASTWRICVRMFGGYGISVRGQHVHNRLQYSGGANYGADESQQGQEQDTAQAIGKLRKRGVEQAGDPAVLELQADVGTGGGVVGLRVLRHRDMFKHHSDRPGARLSLEGGTRMAVGTFWGL